MAKTKTSIKKGEVKNPNGRPPGTPNRTTQEAREFLQMVLYAEFDNIKDSLKNIRENESEAKYIDSLNKMLSFILPKQTDVTSGGEPIKQDLHITVDNSETAETLKRLRNGG